MKPGRCSREIRHGPTAGARRLLPSGLNRSSPMARSIKLSVSSARVRGFDDEVDLGIMVEFIIEDYFGQPCGHAVPINGASWSSGRTSPTG